MGFVSLEVSRNRPHVQTQRTCCLCVPGPAGPVPGLPVAQPGEAGEEGAVCAWLLWCSREFASTRGTKNQDMPLEDGCCVSCSASQGHLCPSWLVPRPPQSLTENFAATESRFYPVNSGNSSLHWEKQNTQVYCKYSDLIFSFQNRVRNCNSKGHSFLF